MVRSNKTDLCLWGIRSPVFAAYLAGEPRGRTPFGFSDMLPARSRWQSVTFVDRFDQSAPAFTRCDCRVPMNSSTVSVSGIAPLGVTRLW